MCARRPENEASEPYLSDIGVPLKGFLQKNAYHFLQQKGLGGLYPSCDDCLSFTVVAAEFWSLQKKYGSQRTTAVIPKIPLYNCCERVPNRPLRGRGGRFGPLLQLLECGILGRTAVIE